MNNAANIVGLHRKNTERDRARDAAHESFVDDHDEDDLLSPLLLDESFAEDMHALPRRLPLAGIAVVLAALGWSAMIALAWWQRDFVLPPLDSLPRLIATVASPLLLLAILYSVVARGGSRAAARFARLTAQLRVESEALESRLSLINGQLHAAQTALRDQATQLEHYGASASANLETTAWMLGEHVVTANSHADSILKSGEVLHSQFRELFDALPQLEDRARAMNTSLDAASQTLAERVAQLEDRLESLIRLTEEARTDSLAATQSVTTQLRQLQDSTRGATEELEGMAELSSSRIGTAIDRARQAMDETSLTLDARMADLNLLVHNSGATLSSIGEDAFRIFGEAIDTARDRLAQLTDVIGRQSRAVADAGERLNGTLDDVTGRFDALESGAAARNESLGLTLGRIRAETEQLDAALSDSNSTLGQLIDRSEQFVVALDTSVQRLEDAHPAALAGFNERLEQTRELVARTLPEIEGFEAVASELFSRSADAERIMRAQRDLMDKALDGSQELFAANTDHLRALDDAMVSADEGIRRLTESSGPQLVAALMRINEAAEHAADKARAALVNAIPDAVAALKEATGEALSQALDDKVEERMAAISDTAEHAVKAAHGASERLMRQLLTIADTTASIENRFKEAEEAVEDRERDHFSRRSALLIERLNSASIKIDKALSSDVSDTGWSAYLKGDRSVFTRRAVSLLDATDNRAVLHLYDADPDFREQVNIYIHDFEAILRGILSTRDGSALGVTMLSSDLGKLYVALAQAIERLRG